MKILIDGRMLSIKQTGISRYIENLIYSYETEYGKSNVNVIVNDYSFSKKYNIVYTKFKPYNYLHFIFFFVFLKRLNFDLLHSPVYSSTFFKKKDRIHVLTVHDLMYKVVPNFFTQNSLINFLAVKYYDLIVKKSLLNSDWIISVSKTTKNDVLKSFGVDSFVYPEGVNVISNAFESDILKMYGLQKENYFLYVGNSRPHKNLQFMIDSFLDTNTNRKLVICGTKKDLFINSDRIIVIGYVLDEDLYSLYTNCSAFVFPSLYEGFGLPVLEALNLGAKVFCSNVGSLGEFPETCVTFFNPYKKESLIHLLESVDTIFKNNNVIENELRKYDWINLMNNFQIDLKINLNKWGVLSVD